MPLRFPRPAMALIATATAAVTIGLSGVPAARADQIRHQEWWLRALGVTSAWTASHGAGVTVAVLSDGVQASHADLAGAVTAAPAPAGAPVASGQYYGEQGTAIASLIAGHGHGPGRGSGIIGVAPAARILSIPVTLPADDPELGQADVAAAIPAAIAAGIRYAVRHRATVIDLPIDPGQPGSAGTEGAPAAAGGSSAEHAAVRYALAHDVILVAPAGDDGASSDAPNYPAAYRGVIAVGAFDSAFTKAPWSSHQRYVTVTAAGAGVLAAASTGGYRTVNSTSAASAVVAGIAALIRARYPHLSVAQVRRAITASTVHRPAGGLADGSGYGTVNAGQAMAAAAALAMPPGRRAGAGAQPLVAPAAVPASPTRGVGPQLLRAGEISAGLLAVLLLLIAAYAAIRRRRRPGSPAVPAGQWTHRQGQSRYPQGGTADAERMLDVFTSPVSEPERSRGGGTAGPGAHWSRADDGLFAPAAGRLAGDAATGPPGTAGAEPGARLAYGPATRAVSRRPVVSGSPPWEPASAPDTELPWTAAAGRHAVGGRPSPAALPSGQEGRPGQQGRRDQPAGQSLFRNTAERGAFGWDGGRWSSAPTTGPVIEGSVLSRSRAASQGPLDKGREPDDYGQYDWSQRRARQEAAARGTSPEPASGPAARQAGPDWPGQPDVAGSGLPVRTPRPADPGPAPLSPSGSLWEPAASEPGGHQSAGGYQSESPEPGSRPIYVWNPSARPSAQGYQPPAGLSGTPGE